MVGLPFFQDGCVVVIPPSHQNQIEHNLSSPLENQETRDYPKYILVLLDINEHFVLPNLQRVGDDLLIYRFWPFSLLHCKANRFILSLRL